MATPLNPLTDAVAKDHQEMYDYYDNYMKSKGDPAVQQRWANQLLWEVSRHAVGEELVIYPLMEKHLGAEGLKLADGDRKDHQFVKESMYKLESMTVGTAEYDNRLKEVMAELRRHNDSEEKNDLPLLAAKIGASGAQDAAARFKRTKKFAPTHPHPSAPDKPPYETLAGFMSAPIDKLRDMFEQFPTEEDKQNAARN